MADVVNNAGALEVTSHVQLNGNASVVSNMMPSNDELQEQHTVESNEEDILQQALDEASESFPCTAPIQCGPEPLSLTGGSLITSEEEDVKFLTANGQVTAVQMTQTFENGSLDILSEVHDEANAANFEVEPSTEQLQPANENGLEYVMQEEGESIMKDDQTNLSRVIDPGGTDTKSDNVDQQQTLLLQQPNGPAPLGSSQNPIRIIQQGNQYTPVQQLTTEQLQQIMQVVQQQQVASKSVDTGSSVLFNPQTNTRIVYRVIYPSELHKEDGANKQNSNAGQTTPKKVYKKRIKEDDIDKIDGPELSKEEKESRKRMRAKTRSGRISKPPKHMVKDFKHIHVLDYDEDYDDSDGGYSDYKVEDEDDRGHTKRDDDGNFIAHGFLSMKPKNWKCITCNKAYIGRAGLGRHLKLYPSHGTLDPESDGMEPAPPGEQLTPSSQPEDSSMTAGNDASTPPNDSTTPNDTTPTSLPATPNGVNSTTNSTASFSEDSRDSSYSLPYTPVSTTPHTRGTGQRGRPRGSRRGWRGRGHYYRGDPETRRRNRLKELMKECSDEELMEVVLPRLAKVITLWEFLLMKVEKGDPAWPHAEDIFHEYEKLHQHVRKLCQEYLLHVPEVIEKEAGARMIQVTDSAMATGLGLKLGHHKVTDIPDSDADLKYKHKLVPTRHVSPDTNRAALKRTLEVVSPEPVASPAKMPRIVSLKQNVVTLTPVQNSSVVTKATGGGADTNVTTTSVLLNHSGSQAPILIQGPPPRLSPSKVKLISPPGTANRTVGVVGKNTGVVPVRTKSLVKISPPSASSQTTKQPSQKFIIISGTDSNASPANAKSISKVPGRNVVSMDTGQIRNNVESGTRLLLPAQPQPQSHMNQIVTISNDQNEISLNNMQSAANVALTPQQVVPINSLSGQQFIMVSQPTQGHSVDKIMINAVGGVKSIQDQSLLNSNPTVQSCSAEVLSNNALLSSVSQGSDTRYLTASATSCDVGDMKFETDGMQNVVYAFQNGADGLMASSSTVPADVSQNSMLFNVGSSGMVSLLKHGPSPADINTGNTVTLSEGNNSQMVMTTINNDQVVGVINSIDNTELQQIKLESTHLHENAHAEAADADSPVVKEEVQPSNELGTDFSNSLDATVCDTGNDSEHVSNVVDVPMEVDSQALINHSHMAALVNGGGDIVMDSTEDNSTSVSATGDSPLVTEKEANLSEVAETESAIIIKSEVASVAVNENDDCSQETTEQVEDVGQGEAVPAPAISIFQTEDGVIFIQNPDGSTLQLQSPDGQNISMETVQALLAMDGETQFIAEQTAVENQ